MVYPDGADRHGDLSDRTRITGISHQHRRDASRGKAVSTSPLPPGDARAGNGASRGHGPDDATDVPDRYPEVGRPAVSSPGWPSPPEDDCPRPTKRRRRWSAVSGAIGRERYAQPAPRVPWPHGKGSRGACPPRTVGGKRGYVRGHYDNMRGLSNRDGDESVQRVLGLLHQDAHNTPG